LQKYHEENAGELEVDLENGWVETKNPEKGSKEEE
jgi:hypothetical protein